MSEDAWSFALRVYATPGVKDACLVLQDEHGQCVSFLLWRAWAAAQGRPVEPPLLSEAASRARHLETTLLGPLREQRRAVARDEAELRAWLLDQELEAERGLLASLEALTPPFARAKPDSLAALRAAADAWRPGAPDDLLAKLAAAC